jgi:transcriptional regulator GlxA family with amidase domain
MAENAFSVRTPDGVSRRADRFGRVDPFPGPATVDPRIRRAEALIHRALHRKLPLRELAGVAGLSVSRLCHLFKNQVGVAPAQYAKLLRMRRAGELLQTSVLSVKEIGGRLGYDDPSRFVEDFRKTYGLPPLRYRERVSQAALVGDNVITGHCKPATGNY